MRPLVPRIFTARGGRAGLLPFPHGLAGLWLAALLLNTVPAQAAEPRFEVSFAAPVHDATDATFEYGSPKKGHGWQPMTNADLVKMMAAQIGCNAPGQ